MIRILGEQKKISIGRSQIEMPGSYLKHLEIGDVVVVLVNNWDLQPHVPSEYNRNIFCFDLSGKHLWRISAAPWSEPSDPAPYTNVFIEDGELRAYCCLGFFIRINVNDGSVEKTDPGGRLW